VTPIYLDYNASAPARDAALEAFGCAARDAHGNPGSLHRFGRDAKRALDGARVVIAGCIGAREGEIVFTGGGTESDNLALTGIMARHPRGHIVTSAVEHPAILETCRSLEARGVRVTRVAVDADGRVDPSRVGEAIGDDTVLVSVMWVNNETGVVQPVEEIAAIARARGVTFHTDAVQAFGRVAIDVAGAGVDLLSISGHKFGAPPGVGALFVRRGCDIEAVMHGGGQEHGRRGGTPALPLAAAMAAAAREACDECAAETVRLGALRDRMERSLLERIPGVAINGAGAARVANTSNIRIPGADSEAVLLALDALGIAVSSASACAAARRDTSHVLRAMGRSAREAGNSLRVSLGYRTTASDVDNFLAVLPDTVEGMRASTKPARTL